MKTSEIPSAVWAKVCSNHLHGHDFSVLDLESDGGKCGERGAGVSASERLFDGQGVGAYDVVFFRRADRLGAVRAHEDDRVVVRPKREDRFCFLVLPAEHLPNETLLKTCWRINWSSGDLSQRFALLNEPKVAGFFEIHGMENTVKFERLSLHLL